MRERLGVLTLVLLLPVLASAEPGLDPSRRTSQGEGNAIREFLRRRVEAAGAPPVLEAGGERIHAAETAARFYEARAYQPAWVAGGAVNAQAAMLVDALDGALDEGLAPSHYHAALLRKRMAAIEDARRARRAATSGELVDAELLLTDAFLLFGSHLASGLVNPQTVDPEWFAARRGTDMAAQLQQALDSGDVADVLAGLAPRQAGYGRLKAALERYRALADWAPVGPSGPMRLGDRSPRVVALRARLAASDDLTQTGTDQQLFDQEVEEAVRRFQARHGIDVDGVVGKEAMLELDTPRADRIRQLEVNLERWRWLPEALGRRHVLVNIAGYEVRAVEDAEVVLQMKAIVGRTYRRTPVFSDQITYLVLNPSWTVPPSIAAQDKLPEIRKDPAYLARHKIRVFTGWGADARELEPAAVDWGAVSARSFPYRLRQDPGPMNALGTVKFMFPNQHNVYLHDTPSRELFAKSARSFSSGCIRIEKPLELATLLLAPDPSWGRARIEAELARGTEQTVRLPEQVPVHIQYWTAWVDEAGAVHFRRDLYDRDRRVAEALHEPPPMP